MDKLVPKVQSTAKILYGIYFALTVLELVFLLVGRMPLFEALLTAFGTAGTGGFGFRNDSFASFSPYIQWVVTIFMILFGVNFNAYFLLLMRKFRRAAASEEVRGYFVVMAFSSHSVIFFCCSSGMDRELMLKENTSMPRFLRQILDSCSLSASEISSVWAGIS